MDLDTLHRVLIADDHALFRQGLSLVLKNIVDGVDVIEAEDMDSAIDAAGSGESFDLILTGETYVPSSVLESSDDDLSIGTPVLFSGDAATPLDSLTHRQRDVLMLVMQGQSNKLIARELGILESTVKAHIQVILQKLNADNRTHAAMIAKEFLQTPGFPDSLPPVR